MRGRTFLNRYIITRRGPEPDPEADENPDYPCRTQTKVICLGNLGQIDTPYLTGTTSGLTYVIDHFKSYSFGAHLTLRRGERSRLADFAAETL